MVRRRTVARRRLAIGGTEFSSLVSGHAPFIVRHGSDFRRVCTCLSTIFVCAPAWRTSERVRAEVFVRAWLPSGCS